ncbi:hypothetical protein Dda_6815 [Drechslerella dactyloides]|uniref:AT hook domain-containing protein family protein n=1 Tax=Drechslerella dactyloides TaxID=74499 RepID=A0AAD6IYI0_DREDA|nr:hypothetical protein Dda_6815 [Drechslerella dactyloides]
MAQESYEQPLVRRSARIAKQAVPPTTASTTDTNTPSPTNRIATLPPAASLTANATGFSKRDITLLQRKQRLLQQQSQSQFQSTSSLTTAQQTALAATLVFAQHEAGTAFCISREGLLLTCAHCVAETVEESRTVKDKEIYLLFAGGRVVAARCVAWDGVRDLALLQITASQPSPPPLSTTTSITGTITSDSEFVFPYVDIAPAAPAASTRVFCIGHPGSEDLESSTARATNYDVLHVSGGRYYGVADGANVHDNSEIGALMHDCWTYWGHSGAAVCLARSGGVVGVHSSWDEGTGMRRGVAWEAIVGFLRERGVVLDL